MMLDVALHTKLCSRTIIVWASDVADRAVGMVVATATFTNLDFRGWDECSKAVNLMHLVEAVSEKQLIDKLIVSCLTPSSLSKFLSTSDDVFRQRCGHAAHMSSVSFCRGFSFWTMQRHTRRNRPFSRHAPRNIIDSI